MSHERFAIKTNLPTALKITSFIDLASLVVKASAKLIRRSYTIADALSLYAQQQGSGKVVLVLPATGRFS